jgi:hypothetical protein
MLIIKSEKSERDVEPGQKTEGLLAQSSGVLETT